MAKLLTQSTYPCGNGILHSSEQLLENGCTEAKVSFNTPCDKSLLEVFFEEGRQPTNFHILPVNKSTVRFTSNEPDPVRGSAEDKSSFFDHTLYELQRSLSRKNYLIPVNDQGVEDKLGVHMYLHNNEVVLNILMREHGYDDHKDMDHHTIGAGNDSAKIPMALAIKDKLVDSLKEVPVTDIDSKNIGNAFIAMTVKGNNAEKANAVYMHMHEQLKQLVENGLVVTGNRADQIKQNDSRERNR